MGDFYGSVYVGCVRWQRLALLGAGAMLLLAWLLPNHYSPWLSAYQDFFSFLAGLFFLCSLLFMSGSVRVVPGVFIFFLLSFIPLVQYSMGLILFSGDAWVASFYLLAFSLMLLVGYNLAQELVSREFLAYLLAWLFIVGAFISVWISLWQWLQLPGNVWMVDLPSGRRPFANLMQPNNLATLICLGVSGVLYLYERYSIGSVVAGLLALFLIFGVALTLSRTPWVAIIAVSAFWVWKSFVVKTRFAVPALLFWVGVYVFVVLSLPHVSEWIFISGEDFSQRAQALERLDIWRQLWFAVWQGPLWGYGWNQISIAQVDVTLAYPVPIMTEHSHNIILDLLLWNGPVLGGGIVIFVAVWLFYLGVQARTVESLFLLIAAGFVLVHAMFEFPLEYAYFLLPLGVLLGSVKGEQCAKHEVKFPRSLLVAFVSLFGGLFFWVLCEYRVVEVSSQLLRFENARVGSLKAERVAPDVVILSQLRELIRYARTSPAEGMSARDLEWMRKVSRRYPNPPSLLRYAQALALNGRPEAARDQLLIFRGLYGEHRYKEHIAELQLMQEHHPVLADVMALLPRF